jgi:hypothetical protein
MIIGFRSNILMLYIIRNKDLNIILWHIFCTKPDGKYIMRHKKDK